MSPLSTETRVVRPPQFFFDRPARVCPGFPRRRRVRSGLNETRDRLWSDSWLPSRIRDGPAGKLFRYVEEVGDRQLLTLRRLQLENRVDWHKLYFTWENDLCMLIGFDSARDVNTGRPIFYLKRKLSRRILELYYTNNQAAKL